MPGNTVRSFLIVFLLAVPVRAGDDGFERFLSGARAHSPERRREALTTLIADPALVPEARWPRTRKVLVAILQKDRKPELRGLAARCLALRRSTESDAHIVHQLVEEESWRAQRPMMEALAGFSDESIFALIEKRAFREPREEVRALYVEALGQAAEARGLPTLLKIAGAPLPWVVAQAAALALGRHPDVRSVDRLIDLLWSEDDGVRTAAFESLVRLTGNRELPEEAGPWVKWWGENRDTFQFPGKKPPVKDPARTVPAGPITVPTYYDIPIRGRKVIYCMDVSASMWGPKFEAALAELSRSIRSLPSNRRFTVIYFNEHPVPWREELLPAFPFQKHLAVGVFGELETKKFTNIFDTLERALGFAGIGRWAKEDPPGLDDLFLLTDGEPNRGRHRDQKNILAGLAALDPKRTVRIHTVSVGEDPKSLMTAIAAQQGGRHHHVEARK
ncbi:MAG: HEAT repeat domain-containing protein [Planctomycetota bacterium]|jgi:hypothetical protein